MKYEELQAEYEGLLASNQRIHQENTSMQQGRSSKLLTHGSDSTVRLDDTQALRLALAEECEQLEEVLSTAHHSINDLLDEYSRLSSEYEGVYREYHRVKYIAEMEDATRDIKLSLLRETLDKKTDEYKLLTKEIKKLEAAIIEAKGQQRSLQREITGIDEKIAELAKVADPELVTAAELCKQIALLSSMLNYSQEKVVRYERYFQSTKPS
jgi:chromosome segregation ATPase